MNSKHAELSDAERARYEWQMWTPGVGDAGQRQLKSASVLVSRLGGLGGTVAYYLAAAGIGKLVLAHAGNVKPSDLNRQLLMTTDWLGRPRIESASRRLSELNPHIDIVAFGENISMDNVGRIADGVDVIVDAAPLFDERFAMNSYSVQKDIPLVEAAMFDMDAQLTTMIPGKTACLACLYPENPPEWKREFPVIGAVSGTVAAMAAVEVIKLICGFGETLAGQLLRIDLRNMNFLKYPIERNPECSVCNRV